VKKYLLYLVLLACCFAQTLALAASQEEIHRQILPLLQHQLPRAAIGIAVADAKTGHILYEHNSFQAFNPASCAKLFSTSASLFSLGPEYRFSTDAYYNKADLVEGTLQGNLTIKFSGDPSMTVDKLKQLVSRIRESGVQRVVGNVVIDNTAFLPPWHGPGWSQDDLNWYYAAPITSVIINQNALGVNITPNPILNKPATLSLADGPLKPFVKLTHSVNTVTYEQSMEACQINLDVDEKNNVTLSGCWPSGEHAQYFGVSVRNPDAMARAVLTHLLNQANIKLEGNIVTGSVPTKLPVVVSVESLPLKNLITTVLKESNNVYAEAITKTLGRHVYHEGSFLAGSRAIKSVLKKTTDIDFTQAVLVDGSGQSRYDLVTPRQIVRLLHVMGNDSKFAELFINALPESGTDGTLSGRMKSADLAHHIHAKTGSFQGTSTLSGYMTTKSGKLIIFSLLINHVVGELDQARSLQTKVATVLYQL
jgi:D-alanyl-D-alanine carboxypeptidase/D-alanyl-D-alanine-endopeptidase (penicillin-binding protein 4)